MLKLMNTVQPGTIPPNAAHALVSPQGPAPGKRLLSALDGLGRVQQNIQFGNQTVMKAAEALAETSVERFSNQIYPFFRRVGKIDIGKMGGLGLEDWAARFLTLIGLYIPQGIIAYKKDSHFWETNGRNALMWGLAVGIVSFAKSDKIGFNTLLNHLMKDKTQADTKTWGGWITSKIGLKGDYFKALKEAGIPFKDSDKLRAFWAGMDSNMIDKVVHKYDTLYAQETAGKALSEAEKGTYKLLAQFLRRRNFCSLASTTLITLATTYIIGKLAMDFVFAFIAPLDHDYEPPHQKGKGNGAGHSVPVKQGPASSQRLPLQGVAGASRMTPVNGYQAPQAAYYGPQAGQPQANGHRLGFGAFKQALVQADAPALPEERRLVLR